MSQKLLVQMTLNFFFFWEGFDLFCILGLIPDIYLCKLNHLTNFFKKKKKMENGKRKKEKGKRKKRKLLYCESSYRWCGLRYDKLLAWLGPLKKRKYGPSTYPTWKGMYGATNLETWHLRKLAPHVKLPLLKWRINACTDLVNSNDLKKKKKSLEDFFIF